MLTSRIHFITRVTRLRACIRLKESDVLINRAFDPEIPTVLTVSYDESDAVDVRRLVLAEDPDATFD
jgi:hypothetical protein